MHNIKKALLGVLMTLGLIIGIQMAVRCCYEDWNLFKISVMRDRKETEGTIDTLYCGSSLAYWAYIPEYLDEKLGTSSFNLGSGAQPVMGTYYLIRDAVEKNPVKKIYYTISITELKKKNINTSSYLSAYEYISSWKWKLRYLAQIMDEEVWMSALFYSTQVEDYFDLKSVKQNLVNKYLNKKENPRYGGRGYRISKTQFEGSDKIKNSSNRTWVAEAGEDQLNEESFLYLQKIAEYCRNEGIELIWVIPPYPEDFIHAAGELDSFNEFLKEKAQEWDVQLYDFTFYKNRESVFTNDKFKDYIHLNKYGAELFCEILAELEINKNPEFYFTR